MTKETSTEKSMPPYASGGTTLAMVESWRAVRPSRVDRSVLQKVAGGMQTWVIAALKYLDLINADGVPTAKLHELATASEDDKPKLIAELLRQSYPYLFTKGVDLANITATDLKQKFIDAGAKGDTANKAMSFFTTWAKAANIRLSPYVLTRQRRSNGTTRRNPKPKPSKLPNQPTPPPTPPAHAGTSPMQVLIEMLDTKKMGQEEQSAVWTLVKYLKKGGS